MGAAKYVSKFDLLKGYWQVPLSKVHRRRPTLHLGCIPIKRCHLGYAMHQPLFNVWWIVWWLCGVFRWFSGLQWFLVFSHAAGSSTVWPVGRGEARNKPCKVWVLLVQLWLSLVGWSAWSCYKWSSFHSWALKRSSWDFGGWWGITGASVRSFLLLWHHLQTCRRPGLSLCGQPSARKLFVMSSLFSVQDQCWLQHVLTILLFYWWMWSMSAQEMCWCRQMNRELTGQSVFFSFKEVQPVSVELLSGWEGGPCFDLGPAAFCSLCGV